jgi:hypothetical protein
MQKVLHFLYELLPVFSPVFEAQHKTVKIFDEFRSDFICGLAVVNEEVVKTKTRSIFVRLKPQYMSGKLKYSIHLFQVKKGW